MKSLLIKIGSASLILAVCLAILFVAGGWLGLARFRRDEQTMKEFHLIKTVASPDHANFALLFEHLPVAKQSELNAVEEIVVVDSQPSLSIPELWMRLKANKEVLRTNAPSSSTLSLEWQNSSLLTTSCLNCTPSMEMLRRASHIGLVSIQYVGFPKDAPFTNVHTVEK